MAGRRGCRPRSRAARRDSATASCRRPGGSVQEEVLGALTLRLCKGPPCAQRRALL
jgi:hypothetical protein